MTLSVQLVGLYLVFATLIVPPLATRTHVGRARLARAWGVGVAGYASGIAVSAALDLPTGPLIVWTLAVIGLVHHVFSTRRVSAPAVVAR